MNDWAKGSGTGEGRKKPQNVVLRTYLSLTLFFFGRKRKFCSIKMVKSLENQSIKAKKGEPSSFDQIVPND
jgi:hypothetical protein